MAVPHRLNPLSRSWLQVATLLACAALAVAWPQWSGAQPAATGQPAASPASSAAEVAADRARLQQAQAAVLGRYRQAEQACASEFQVNRCLAEAQAEQRQALERLKRAQATLDEQDRRRRADERLAAVARKTERAAARAAAASAAVAEQSTASKKAPAPGRAQAPAPSGVASGPKAHPRHSRVLHPPDTAAKAAQAQHRAEAQARREAKVAARADAAARRNAARDARHPPAAGLPPPAGAASALSPPPGGR